MMFLKSIEITNFRPFYGYNIFEFGWDEKKNINIISGKNGTGKSEFLNSIYWCLYGKEILEHSTQPLCNYNSINDAGVDEEIEVSVICEFIYKDKILSIQRKIKFVKNNVSDNLIGIGSDFSVLIEGIPVSFTETFIRKHFSEFSFSLLFDIENEALTSDEYMNKLKLFFHDLDKLNIIDQVDNHLNKLSKRYHKELVKFGTHDDLARFSYERNSILEEIEKNNKDINDIHDELTKCEEKHFEIENKMQSNYFNNEGLDKLIIDKSRMEEKINVIFQEIKKINIEKEKLIFKSFPIIVISSGIENNFNNENLENMLLKNAEFQNTDFYRGYFNIPFLFEKLQYAKDIKLYMDKEKFLEEKVSRMIDERENLKCIIENIDDESFKKIVFELKKLDELSEVLHKKIDVLKYKEKHLIKELNHIEKEISRFEKLNSPDSHELKLDFCNNLLDFGKKVRFQLIDKELTNFSKMINWIFIDCFEMNIKFKKINVDKSYDISIIKNSNQVISIEELSSSEKRLFKFSLMFAINKILDFKYPLVLMDPFINLDDYKKDKLLEIILNDEFNNQIILIINDNQYDKKIKADFLKRNVVENKLTDYEGNWE